MKTKPERINKNFSFGQQNVSFVLETGFELGTKKFMPYFKGFHTVKKVGENQNQAEVRKFEFKDNNIINGFLDVQDLKCADLTNKNHKIVKKFSGSIYHIFADDISEVIAATRIYPKAEFIFDISDIKMYLDSPSWNLFQEFLNGLDRKNIKYKLIELAKYDVLYINNFSLCIFPFASGIKGDALYNFFDYLIDDHTVKPTRHVYVSRKKVDRQLEQYEHLSFKEDIRIDNHEELENIFRDLGFEIVYPEDFKSFKDQINFFYSVKTIASLTSSGLINSVFMQPGNNIVEVVVPLVVKHPNLEDYILEQEGYAADLTIVAELHAFYHNLAFLKDHLYIGIPNYNRNANDVRKFIDSHPNIKEVLKSE